MILTLTANPSHDRTVALAAPLERGAVMRASSVTSQAGGKGVNISRASVAAGVPSLAVLPAPPDDPFVLELLSTGAWSGVGVLGPEAFPAQPFLEKLAELGSPHGVLELAP